MASTVAGRRRRRSSTGSEDQQSGRRSGKKQRTGLEEELACENAEPQQKRGRKHDRSPAATAIGGEKMGKRRKFSPPPALAVKRPRDAAGGGASAVVDQDLCAPPDVKRRKLKHVVPPSLVADASGPKSRKVVGLKSHSKAASSSSKTKAAIRRFNSYIPPTIPVHVDLEEDVKIEVEEVIDLDEPERESQVDIFKKQLEERENARKIAAAEAEKRERERLEELQRTKREAAAEAERRAEAEQHKQERAQRAASAAKKRDDEANKRAQARNRDMQIQESAEKREQEQRSSIRERVVPELQRVIRNKDVVQILNAFYPQCGLSDSRAHRTTQIRKALVRALAHFHPDRKEIRQLSLDDRVRAEEIYKIINDCRDSL
eukprot:TRINITY_DN5850_c0_g1_i1.p1 TRINITY_DN5850_c0_g1~~TRINITY_DN5850_c0_g1_i1.p1  ORF type:complete len:375 (+),score=97.40 TRINITY_DN5850_c0_g1_i1:37-1161(+)